MGKKLKDKKSNKNKFFTKGTIIGIAVIVTAVSIGAYYSICPVPVNESVPVCQAPTNVYILALHSDQGYSFESQSTRTGKKTLSNGSVDPSIHVIQGELVALHVINEDKDTQSKQNLVIDEFKVHTKDLNPPAGIFFDSQTITFLADKVGTYQYYSTIHPEMKGTVVVDPQ